MAETTISREDLIAALEACAKGTCCACPLQHAPSDTCWELKKEAAEIIRSQSEEIDTLRAQRDNYHREYLRQKVETEYQTRRADLLHEQLQRVFDMYVRAELRTQEQEDDSHADDD